MRGLRCLSICTLVLAVMSLSSCVTWTRVENPHMIGPHGQYQVTVPDCWIHAAFISDKICFSKDGPALNWIEVSHFSRSSGFPLTKVNLKGEHLISEVAEYYLAEIKVRFQSVTANHLSTEPVEINGKPGFKMRLELILPSGLEFDVLAYGMMDDDNFYHILYKAPRIYYFDKDLSTFEDFVTTFKTAL